MSDEKMSDWTKNWKRRLLEVFVIAGILASAFATFVGAYQLVNHNILVTILFTAFFQGGMYVIGHYTSLSETERERRRTSALCLAWLVLAFFSVYSSALGMFEIQRDSLKKDHSRSGVFKQWNEAAKAIADFKTRALAEINQAKQATSLDLNMERSRVRVARAQKRSYSTEALQRFSSELDALNGAESRLRQVKQLSLSSPEDFEAASRALDDAFGSVGEAYAALPERLRARITAPKPSEPTEIPEHIQKAFWKELTSGSVPVLLTLAFALMLDLLPPMVLYATAPKRTLPERVLAFRKSIRALKDALRSPLSADIETVRVTVQDLPNLDIQITIPTVYGGPLLDIDRDFAEVTAEVCRKKQDEMQLESVKTASGKPLVDGLPLLKQLGQGREVVLSYISGFGDCSKEVN